MGLFAVGAYRRNHNRPPGTLPGQMKGALMANLNVTYDQMSGAAGRLRDGQGELEATLGGEPREAARRARRGVTQVVQVRLDPRQDAADEGDEQQQVDRREPW